MYLKTTFFNQIIFVIIDAIKLRSPSMKHLVFFSYEQHMEITMPLLTHTSNTAARSTQQT